MKNNMIDSPLFRRERTDTFVAVICRLAAYMLVVGPLCKHSGNDVKQHI